MTPVLRHTTGGLCALGCIAALIGFATGNNDVAAIGVLAAFLFGTARMLLSVTRLF
jgi:hypothetical protein